MVVFSKQTVGIFSREDSTSYQWVTDLLLSPRFRSVVQDVRPVNVTNVVRGGSGRFQEEVARCSAAILYHSQNRGRLNITDVTDALYNDEIRDLSRRLGLERVLVLVDDVEGDPAAVYNNIILEQPSVREHAALLVVFSSSEKPVYGTGSYQTSLSHETSEKIESIRSQLKKGRKITKMGVFLVVAGVVGVILIIVLCVELAH